MDEIGTVQALEKIAESHVDRKARAIAREALPRARAEAEELEDRRLMMSGGLLQHWYDRAITAETELATQAEELERLRGLMIAQRDDYRAQLTKQVEHSEYLTDQLTKLGDIISKQSAVVEAGKAYREARDEDWPEADNEYDRLRQALDALTTDTTDTGGD